MAARGDLSRQSPIPRNWDAHVIANPLAIGQDISRVPSPTATATTPFPRGGGTLSGVISNPAGPLAGARLLMAVDGNVADSRTRLGFTAADGSYTFNDLAPGNYVVIAFDPAGTYRSKATHTVVP